jgi:hypothetical protein
MRRLRARSLGVLHLSLAPRHCARSTLSPLRPRRETGKILSRDSAVKLGAIVPGVFWVPGPVLGLLTDDFPTECFVLRYLDTGRTSTWNVRPHSNINKGRCLESCDLALLVATDRFSSVREGRNPGTLLVRAAQNDIRPEC